MTCGLIIQVAKTLTDVFALICVCVRSCTHSCISILCSLSDLADPAGEIFQTVSCYVQSLDRMRREVLGVDSEHKGPGILSVFMHHCRD